MLSPAGTSILAACVLSVAALALAAWGWFSWHRTKYKLSQCPLYLYCQIMTRVVWRTQVSGPLPIADDQGAIIVSNHRGSLDPACIALTCRRPVHWMVAKEYCNSLAFGWFFHNLGSIPVNRGGIDTASTRTAIRLAQSGELVGMFPEGRINETGCFLLPGRPGAALVALRAKVPVVPCWMEGMPYDGTVYSSVLMTGKVKVKVGKAIDLSSYYGRENEKGVQEELTLRFLKEIATLGGRPDYEPQLAGRRWKPGQETELETAETA